MLRGASSLSIDSKGRMAVPTKYRDLLMADCDGSMICTVDLHQSCLLLYPLTEWEDVEAQLRRFSSMNPHERRIQRVLLGNAAECDMDKNGRLLLPATLRQHANLSKQIMLVGQLNKFEIWDEQTWQDQLKEDIDAEMNGEFELSDNLQSFTF
ncbi:division/cell wall cluster transcriptional repressor MraZ [Flocculibacter collagenilyticus]|uniref:division/cell wall cluster transcriptional repressor MraZ n=1 Tax=Flocculibacter collagenilyticus TaxID=2744479 RepID=UPI0018F4FA43|nr:division/cell wall cluster transcriptional repressor MraZ [Flocculibacter collagenilyticus]